MAIAFVKHVGNYSSGATSVTSLSVTVPPAGVAAGNTLILRVVCEPDQGPDTFSAADPRGNSYTQDAYQMMSGNYPQTAIMSARIATSLQGGDTITVALPANTRGAVAIDEFSGTLVKDVANAVPGNSSTPTVSTSPSTANELFVGAVFTWSSTLADGFTEDSDTLAGSWTTLTRIGGSGVSVVNGAYKVASTNATQTYNPVLASGKYWSNLLVAYKSVGTPASVTDLAADNLTYKSVTLKANANPGSASNLRAEFEIRKQGTTTWLAAPHVLRADDFNRPDSRSLGAGWVKTGTSWQLVGGALTSTASSTASSVRTATPTFPSDLTVGVTIASNPYVNTNLYITTGDGTTNAYYLRAYLYSPPETLGYISLYRVVSGSHTSLISQSVSSSQFGAGARLFLTREGTALRVYSQMPAGPPVLITSVADSTFNGPWYVLLDSNSSSASPSLDDFKVTALPPLLAAGGNALGADQVWLERETTYEYRVRLFDGVTTSYSSIASFTTPAPAAPSATGLTVSAITHNSATLSATLNPGDYEGVQAQFQIAETSIAYQNVGPAVALRPGSTVVTRVASGLESWQHYLYRIVLTDGVSTWTVDGPGFETLRAFDLSQGGTLAGGSSLTISASLGTGGATAAGNAPGLRLALGTGGATSSGRELGILTPPKATTMAADALTNHKATVHAIVIPSGLDTSYYFEWGTSTSYGNSSAPADVGDGSGEVAVELELLGLEPLTTYYYRVVATNALGTTYGARLSVHTLPDAPSVTIEPASDVGAWYATLNGAVDPKGASTTYQFEYGPTTAYGLLAPIPDGNAGASTSPVAVSADIDELDDLAVYHYRLKATNAGGTSYSSDTTFTTEPLPPVVQTTGAGGITTNQATLSGKVSWPGPGRVWLEWGQTAQYGNETDHYADTDPSNLSFNRIVSPLAPYTFYHYRIVAENGGGITYGEDRLFRTLPYPAAVGALDAIVLSHTTAQLQALVSTQAAATFRFEWGLDDSYGNATPETQMVAGYNQLISVPVTGLDPETVYHFRAVVTNSAGAIRGADNTFQTFVFPSPFGDSLYQAMSPQARKLDPENGYALRTYCYGIGQMFDPIEYLAREGDNGDPGWSSIFDLKRAPANALPYLAQYAGTVIPKGLDADQARALIDAPSGLRRGTLGAIVAAAKATLTGSAYVRVNERDTSAYHMTVFTRTSETPNPTATLNAMLAVKPAGIVLDHVVTDGVTWAEATQQWQAVEATWTNADIDDIT